MGYESDPLPYYIELRNFYYSIILNYKDSLSTPQVHLTITGTIISSYGYPPESATHQYIVHQWVGMPHFPLWLHDTS